MSSVISPSASAQLGVRDLGFCASAVLSHCMWDEPRRICPWEDKALRFSAECCLLPAPRSCMNECFSRLPRPLQMLLSVRCVLKNEYVKYSSLNQVTMSS